MNDEMQVERLLDMVAFLGERVSALELAAQQAPLSCRKHQSRTKGARLAISGSAAALLVGLVLWSPHALSSDACGTSLPGNLVPFCANQAALASHMNQNFQAVLDIIQKKVGSLNEAGVSGVTVSASNVSATASVSARGVIADSITANTISANTRVTTAAVSAAEFLLDGTTAVARDGDWIAIDPGRNFDLTYINSHAHVEGNLTVTGKINRAALDLEDSEGCGIRPAPPGVWAVCEPGEYSNGMRCDLDVSKSVGLVSSVSLNCWIDCCRPQ